MKYDPGVYKYDPDTDTWPAAIPEPYYHSLLPWIWKRLGEIQGGGG